MRRTKSCRPFVLTLIKLVKEKALAVSGAKMTKHIGSTTTAQTVIKDG
jgi:hypothetical protein